MAVFKLTLWDLAHAPIKRAHIIFAVYILSREKILHRFVRPFRFAQCDGDPLRNSPTLGKRGFGILLLVLVLDLESSRDSHYFIAWHVL
jgi:hypothetical protein